MKNSKISQIYGTNEGLLSFVPYATVLFMNVEMCSDPGLGNTVPQRAISLATKTYLLRTNIFLSRQYT